MAGRTLILGLHRGRHVLVAYEAFGVRGGSFLGVMNTETLGMERRLYVPRMTGRCLHALHGIGVAGSAIRHPEFGGDALRGIVALDTIQHSGQRKVREAGASRNRVVTGGTVNSELLF